MDIGTIKEGNHIIYGNNGICTVESITEMAFSAGEDKKTYFILRPLADRNSVIYLPRDNEILTSRLRPLLTKEEIAYILSHPLDCKTDWIDDKKLRAAAFREKISSNHIPTLLSLVKCLCQKRDELVAQNKKVLLADHEALATALKAIRNEFSFVLELPQENLTEILENYLEVTL